MKKKEKKRGVKNPREKRKKGKGDSERKNRGDGFPNPREGKKKKREKSGWKKKQKGFDNRVGRGKKEKYGPKKKGGVGVSKKKKESCGGRGEVFL